MMPSFGNQAWYLISLSFKVVEWNKKSKRGIHGNLINRVIPSLLYMIGLLGTSNCLVWGIDEWPFTHHFRPEKPTKMTKNTQKWPYNVTNILGMCFCVFQVQMDWKRVKREQNGAWMGSRSKTGTLPDRLNTFFEEKWRKRQKAYVEVNLRM